MLHRPIESTLYTVYWFYKHYAQIKAACGESMWPVARALFPVFFAFNLFKRIQEAGNEKDIQVGWTYQSLAPAFMALTLLYNLSGSISPIVGVLSLATMPMLSYIVTQVQATANEIQNDAQGATNQRFTVFNILWCVLGFLMWTALLLDAAVTFGFVQL